MTVKEMQKQFGEVIGILLEISNEDDPDMQVEEMAHLIDSCIEILNHVKEEML